MRPDKRLRLYAITPDEIDSGRLLYMLEQTLAAGVGIVQYRNKLADARLRLKQASAVHDLCRQYAVPLIINDHLDLALTVDADGLHLGADDGDLIEARQKLASGKWLGASCYASPLLAHKAIAAGADYIAFGAFFTSTSKPQAAQAPLQLLQQAASLPCPVCAIGGIDASNAAQVVRAGAHWLAVIGSLFNSADPGAATQALCLAMNQGFEKSGA